MPRSAVGKLQTFLEAANRPSGTLRYHELEGFLFAVASAPELVKPSEWLPFVFDDQEPGFADVDEAQTIVRELMIVYNSINAAVYEGHAALPAGCRLRRAALANLEDAAPVAQWSRGFLRGHQWLEESWDAYIPDELDEEYASMLMTLSFFASKQLAEAFCEEAGGADLAEMSETIVSLFPDALAEYARLGRSIQQAVAQTEAAERPRRAQKKIGRNDPCPCGSGQKYKRCCGVSPT